MFPEDTMAKQIVRVRARAAAGCRAARVLTRCPSARFFVQLDFDSVERRPAGHLSLGLPCGCHFSLLVLKRIAFQSSHGRIRCPHCMVDHGRVVLPFPSEPGAPPSPTVPPPPPARKAHTLFLGKPVDPRWYRLVTAAAEALPPDNADRIAIEEDAELARQLQDIVKTVKCPSSHPHEYRLAIQKLLSDPEKIEASEPSTDGWLSSLTTTGEASMMKWLAFYVLNGMKIYTVEDFKSAAASVLAEYTWESMPLILLWLLAFDIGSADIISHPPTFSGDGHACYYYGVVMPARKTLLDRLATTKGPASVVEGDGEDSDSTIEIAEDTYTCRSCGSSLHRCRCSHGGALLSSVENIGSPVLRCRARTLTVSGRANVLLSSPIFE
jgi:hypothetical protein